MAAQQPLLDFTFVELARRQGLVISDCGRGPRNQEAALYRLRSNTRTSFFATMELVWIPALK